MEPLTVRQRHLVGGNRGLAYLLAFRFYNSHDDSSLAGNQDDYVQEALLAVMKAAVFWDPAHGSRAKFDTYAGRCIWNSLIRFYSESRLVHVPRWAVNKARETGGWFPQAFPEAFNNASSSSPPPGVRVNGSGLEGYHKDDDNKTVTCATAPDEEQPFDLDEDRRWLAGKIRELPGREGEVLRLRYDLRPVGEPIKAPVQGRSLRQVAALTGLSHESVRKIYQKAVKHLREAVARGD